jgi:hypothetical protein
MEFSELHAETFEELKIGGKVVNNIRKLTSPSGMMLVTLGFLGSTSTGEGPAGLMRSIIPIFAIFLLFF